jgi:nitroreductase
MYSARALRKLKPDPVPEDLLTKILDAAIRAPSAGNAQNWAFVVVRDPEQRRRLGVIYRKAAAPVLQYHFNWKTLSAMAGVTWWNFCAPG